MNALLGCFHRTSHENYKLVEKISSYMHTNLPTSNHGQPRSVCSIYNFIQQVLKRNYTLDKDGFRQAEDDYEVNYYEDASPEPTVESTSVPMLVSSSVTHITAPLGNTGTTPCIPDVSSLTGEQRQQLFQNLLQEGGALLLEETISVCSEDFAVKLLGSIGRSVCKRMKLPEDLVDCCVDASLRCEVEGQPNLIHEVATVLQNDEFPLDTILFWTIHYNMKYFMLEYSSQMSYTDDPGYYKDFWETLYHIGGCGVIDFLRGAMHSGQTLIGKCELNKYTPYSAKFSFPGIPHLTTIIANKSKEKIAVGIDIENMKIAVMSCRTGHVLVFHLDDTDISAALTKYQGEDYGDEDIGNGELQARRIFHKGRVDYIERLTSNLKVPNSDIAVISVCIATCIASFVRPVQYYTELSSALTEQKNKLHSTIEKTIREHKGNYKVPATTWKKLAEMEGKLVRYTHIISASAALKNNPNPFQTHNDAKECLIQLRHYLLEDFELHRTKATKLRAFLVSDTARSFSIAVAKYPIGTSLGEAKTRDQIKLVLQAAHEQKAKVSVIMVDGDFGFLALRDFDGSALTRNEMLRQLRKKWEKKTREECFKVVDRRTEVHANVDDINEDVLRMMMGALQHPQPKTVKIAEGRKWLKAKDITHLFVALEKTSVSVVRYMAAKSQVQL